MVMIIKAPQELWFPGRESSTPTIFLGGSIEMGTAENWQSRVEEKLKNYDVVILNPRRDDWDSSWNQSKDNPQFFQQVRWELDAQDEADLRIYYFSPETKSPITLMELGLYAHDNNLVCCPEGFWRKGNVDIVCDQYGIPMCDNIEDLLHALEEWCIERI